MKSLIVILGLLVTGAASPVWAQLSPPNEMGVSMGEVGLVVRDLDANVKFFIRLGGTPMKIDGVDVIKFPGILVFITKGNPLPIGQRRTQVFCGCPTDGIETSVVSHIGFNVQNYDESFDEFTKGGVHIENFHNAKSRSFFFTPDGLMLEIAQSRKPTAPVGEFHVHTFVNDMQPKDHEHQVVGFEMFLWYHQMFGTEIKVGTPGSGLGHTLPGGLLLIGETRETVTPTKGHVLDHIGFEVKNLEAFCKQLEKNGVRLDAPYSTTRHKSFASAELTDPWGTSVELTEGLDKF